MHILKSSSICGKPSKLGAQNLGACEAAKFAVLKTCALLLPSPLQAKKGKRVSDDSFWTFFKKNLAL